MKSYYDEQADRIRANYSDLMEAAAADERLSAEDFFDVFEDRDPTEFL